MKHPDSSQVIDVAPAQVPLYESQGWRKQPSTKKAAAKKATKSAK
jgi:hypothetical protein